MKIDKFYRHLSWINLSWSHNCLGCRDSNRSLRYEGRYLNRHNRSLCRIDRSWSLISHCLCLINRGWSLINIRLNWIWFWLCWKGRCWIWLLLIRLAHWDIALGRGSISLLCRRISLSWYGLSESRLNGCFWKCLRSW